MYTTIGSTPRIDAVSKLRWYLTSDILAYINQLRQDVLNGRLTLTQSIDHIRSDAPFGIHWRFPESGMYICEGIGTWNERLQHMRHYAAMMSHPQRLLHDHPRVRSRGDAELLLLQLINASLHAYEAADDFIDRKSFETRYDLTWEDIPLGNEGQDYPWVTGDQLGPTWRNKQQDDPWEVPIHPEST